MKTKDQNENLESTEKLMEANTVVRDTAPSDSQTNQNIGTDGEFQDNVEQLPKPDCNSLQPVIDSFLEKKHTQQYAREKCPIIYKFNFEKDCDEIIPTDYVHITKALYGSKIKTNRIWAVVATAIAVIAIIALCFLPKKTSGQVPTASLGSTKVNIPILVNEDSCRFIFTSKIVVDSTYVMGKDTAATDANGRVAVHGEIVYRNTSWQVLVYRLAIAVLLTTILLIFLKYLMPYCSRLTELKQKEKERRQNDAIRLYEEDREHERLRYKTEIGLYEKLQKAKIDEWVRDNEQQRKLEILEREYLTELSHIFEELAKAKNTITFENCGKKVVIERSVLSCDCCEKLQGIMTGFFDKDDCGCEEIKKVLRCLFYKDGKIDCEKLKKALKCLFCDCCNEKNKEMMDLLKEAISIYGKNNLSGNCTVNVSNQQ